MDPEYIEDFLLIFRVFLSQSTTERDRKLPPGMVKLCLALINWLDNPEYRDRVVKIILSWLSSYYHDFEINSDYSYLFFKLLEAKLTELSMTNQLHLLNVTLSTKSKVRHVTISRSSREQPLPFAIGGGYEKNCGIFIVQVYGSIGELKPHDKFMQYLQPHHNASCESITARFRSGISDVSRLSHAQASLKSGDQILEVNGNNFAAINLVDAQRKLDMSTHLSLTVKYNPSAFQEMRLVPEGRRKSSLSSMPSVSPYLPSNAPSRFTFQDKQLQEQAKQHDNPPPSPLFSTNANFGFRSIIKNVPKSDKSRLLSLFNTSKQIVKQFRDTTAQISSNNSETMSKTSDNNSDNQSYTDVDLCRSKSISELAYARSHKDKFVESGLSNVVRAEANAASIADSTNNHATDLTNQAMVNVLKVYNAANNEFRYLLIHEETTAREVVMVAVNEFGLTSTTMLPNSPPSSERGSSQVVSSLNWHLYEVSVVPESKTIKQKCLSEQTSKLAERASLCSRFYIKNNSQSSFGPTRLDMGDDVLVNEILKESPPYVTLSSLNATLLAVELTLADFNKFKNIEPQQFVYDTFFDYLEKEKDNCNNSETGSNRQSNGTSGCSSSDSASLRSTSSDGHDNDLLHVLNKTRKVPKEWVNEYQEFADISNKEMFWVVCEILNERNIGRRVKIVKQFIRVADVCSQLRNFNSMFAIISGLGHSCVNRLRRTFEKLKPKYKNQLDKMRELFDPSRNMLNYRECLKQTPPPAIPLFPQIKKDLTFTKEGRPVFVRETNELSDEEDLANDTERLGTIRRKTHHDTATDNSSPYIMPNAVHSRPVISKLRKQIQTNEPDVIMVNFAEIREFTERVRNVIHFSSVPYSSDLLSNVKDANQRSQSQMRKKMHEEWQMRKRIRFYIQQAFDAANITNDQKSVFSNGVDQMDGTKTDAVNDDASQRTRVSITYDERILHKRSLDIEPEVNHAPPRSSYANERPNARQMTRPTQQPQLLPPTIPMTLPSPLPPATISSGNLGMLHINAQAPMVGSNSSPTLSKSSSLSSCSSFNNHNSHLGSLHLMRNNLVNGAVGKFGTESTESLRKLQALSENVDDWRISSYGSGGNVSNNGSSNNARGVVKNIVPSRIFPPKK